MNIRLLGQGMRLAAVGPHQPNLLAQRRAGRFAAKGDLPALRGSGRGTILNRLCLPAEIHQLTAGRGRFKQVNGETGLTGLNVGDDEALTLGTPQRQSAHPAGDQNSASIGHIVDLDSLADRRDITQPCPTRRPARLSWLGYLNLATVIYKWKITFNFIPSTSSWS
jgi:hypothetical protein